MHSSRSSASLVLVGTSIILETREVFTGRTPLVLVGTSIILETREVFTGRTPLVLVGTSIILETREVFTGRTPLVLVGTSIILETREVFTGCTPLAAALVLFGTSILLETREVFTGRTPLVSLHSVPEGRLESTGCSSCVRYLFTPTRGITALSRSKSTGSFSEHGRAKSKKNFARSGNSLGFFCRIPD